MSTSPPQPKIDETLTVEILAQSDFGVVDAPFHLLFDPAVLGFVDAVQGNFLSQDGTPVVFIANGRTRPGEVTVGIGRTDRQRGAMGSGVLARIRFKAIASGETALRLDRSLAWDGSGNPMEVNVADTAVVVVR